MGKLFGSGFTCDWHNNYKHTAKKNKAMKYYCVKQRDLADCGAACIATVLKQYGYQTSIEKIRQIAGTDRMGTNAYGLIQAAEAMGLTTKAVKGDQEAFFSEFPLPAIAHVVVDGSLLHYVVVHKIAKDKVVIADPAKGIKKVTPEVFFGEWTGILILMVPSDSFQTGNEKKGLFERFFSLLKPQKRLVFNVFFLSLFITGLGVLGAFYFQIIIDDILPAGIQKTLTVLSIGVIALNVFAVVLAALRQQLLLYLSQKLDIALLLGYYNHVLKLPMAFFETRKVGEIISRFQDASSIRDAISNATLTVMIDVLMALAGGAILFVKNKVLFAISCAMVVLYAILVILFNMPYKKANQKQMEDNAKLTSYLVESLNGIQTVKAFDGEEKVETETEFKFIRLLKSVFYLSSLNNAQESIKSFVKAIGGTIIIWVGAYYVLQGEMTIGSLVSFNALLVYFLDPVRNLIDLQPMMQTAVVASDRLGEIMDLEIEKNDAQRNKLKPKSLTGDIVIDDIFFRYGTRQLVLEHFSMVIKKGQRIAIVGESGAGKTTVAKLLLNLYQYEAGTIMISGYALPDISLDVLREKVAYIPQETFLFSGTIMENLTFGIDNPNMEEVIACSKMAQLDEFVNQLPLRYETFLDENGKNLSGGQRQRIAIARAMLKKPDILILDEATSHLDSVTELAIQKTIDSYSEKMTTIVIAHRLSTIRKCDEIFVMEHGKIVENGTHESLINRRNGYYRQLYDAQVGETE